MLKIHRYTKTLKSCSFSNYTYSFGIQALYLPLATLIHSLAPISLAFIELTSFLIIFLVYRHHQRAANQLSTKIKSEFLKAKRPTNKERKKQTKKTMQKIPTKQTKKGPHINFLLLEERRVLYICMPIKSFKQLEEHLL
jgi:hypothetical protein